MFRFLNNLWTRFKEYIVLVILILISLIILSQNQNQEVQKLRAIAFGSFAAVTSVLTDLFSVTNLRRENEDLRRTNAKLMMQISKLRNYGIENKELKGLLALKDTSDLPFIPSTVVSRSLSKTQNTITLNAGANDGVLPGMPVINDRGLVGMIHSISDDYCIARTINNVDLKLTVMDERSRVNGILKWTGEELIIINIPFTFDIEIGDRIVTSEISSIVPVPIPVGIVADFKESNSGVFSYINVKPFVDLTPVENVFIIAQVRSKQIDDLELNFYRRQ